MDLHHTTLAGMHLPDSDVIETTKEMLEDNLPEDYEIEMRENVTSPSEQAELPTEHFLPPLSTIAEDVLRNEEDVRYEIIGPGGNPLGSVGFQTVRANGKEKINAYTMQVGGLQREDNDLNIPYEDQRRARFQRFVSEDLPEILGSGIPERPPEDELDGRAILEYDAGGAKIEGREVRDFQARVRYLEERGIIQIDPQGDDRDIFYSQEEMHNKGVRVVIGDQERFYEEIDDTDLYVREQSDL